jgi:hypothetical protein
VSPSLVALCYGSALVVSLALLWYFGVKHWYWHVFSFVLAIAIGLTPLPDAFNTPQMTLVVGWVFLFLFVWGVGAPFFVLAHEHPHFGHHVPR